VPALVFSGGNSLIIGVPASRRPSDQHDLAVLDLKFSRIQFTPDLMPSDITGTDIIQEDESGDGSSCSRGPIFANIVLADEINRTPPKTQSALLEAMQEHRVTVQGKTYSTYRALPRVCDANRSSWGHVPAARSPARPVHVNITWTTSTRTTSPRGDAHHRGDEPEVQARAHR